MCIALANDLVVRWCAVDGRINRQKVPQFRFVAKRQLRRHRPPGTAIVKASTTGNGNNNGRKKRMFDCRLDCRPPVRTWPVRNVNAMISTWFHIKQRAGNGLAWFKYKINSITYTSNDTAEKKKKRNCRNQTRTDDCWLWWRSKSRICLAHKPQGTPCQVNIFLLRTAVHSKWNVNVIF